MRSWTCGRRDQDVHDAGQLAQADNLAVGKIRDVGLAEEGQKMMFAHALEADVAHQHHFVVLFDEGLAEHLGRVGVQSGEHFLVHAGHTLRRFAQALAVGVFADGQEDLPHRRGQAGVIDGMGRVRPERGLVLGLSREFVERLVSGPFFSRVGCTHCSRSLIWHRRQEGTK